MHINARTRACAGIILAAIAFSSACRAAPGDLDPSFGVGGKVFTNIGTGNLSAVRAVALQADGKIVAAGSGSNGDRIGFAVARFNADGTLDTAFNGTGKVNTDVGTYLDGANALAIQPDGKIVVAGDSIATPTQFRDPLSQQVGMAIVRYNTDGSLDTGFNGNGMVVIFPAGGIRGGANALALQPDGKIVVAGSFVGDFALARLNADGSLDTTFSGDGLQVTDFGAFESATAVAIQADGHIVVAGYTENGTTKIALARYNADGSLDSTWNGTGKSITTVGGINDRVNAMLVQSDGRIVVAGSSNNGANEDFALVRFDSNGNLDTTFNGTGTVTTAVGTGFDDATGLAILPNGMLVASGHSEGAFALVRYNTDGSLDAGFNGTGIVTTNFSGDVDWSAVAIQADGKIISAGKTATLFALVRNNADGSLDTTFNGTGKVTTAMGSSKDFAYGAALQSDGKIVVTGTGETGFVVARYLGNGSLDTTFNGTGIVSTVVGPSVSSAHAVAIQADGKIVVAGSASIPSNNFNADFALVRYNPDGSLDTTFNGTGKVITPVGSLSDEAYAIAIQPDGKIVVAGFAANPADSDFALVRYNGDGSLDTTFNGTGKVITALSASSQDLATAIAIQPDGRIVVAGYTGISSSSSATYDFALVRYTPTGAIDAVDTEDLGTATDFAFALAIQPDGRILVGGQSGSNGTAAVLRLQSPGSRDPSFATGGLFTNSAPSISSIQVRPDGRILLVTNHFGILQLMSDGTLDATFGQGGIGGLPFDARQGSNAALMQPDGRIVLVGQGYNGEHGLDFMLVRFQGSGSDTDGDGIPDTVEHVEMRNPLVKDNDVFTNARLFAMQQCRDFFAAECSPYVLQFWSDGVASGNYSRSQAIEAFLSSFAANYAPVTRLYFATFLRIPDYAGVVFNAGLVGNGTVTLRQLADFFTVSPEFQATYGALDNTQFVTLLYNNVLGRAPEPAGLNGWLALMQSGYSRGQVLMGFSESVEYQAATANETFITMLYLGMMRRSPDPAGFNGWVGALDNATYTTDQVISAFFLSTEYHNRFLP